MKKFYISKSILFFFFTLFMLTSFAQQPIIQWQKSLGGTNWDYAYSIQQTTDGGYVVAGYSASIDGDVTGNHGGVDYWIVKLNSSGAIQWQKSLGGTNDDWATSIQQTTDGGYILAGLSYSNDGDVTGNHGFRDYWIVKLNSSGVIDWQKSLGGTENDEAYSIRQTSDLGYIVVGESWSNNGDVTGNHGVNDFWIVKLNSSGTIQWQKSLGGSSSDNANSVQQTTDGGYIVAGESSSNDGDVTGHHGSTNIPDYWIVKLNSSGAIQWQKSLGGTNVDNENSAQQTTDGGYIIWGRSFSNDGDVTGNHGNYDYWIVKLNSSGTIQWQKCFGGTNGDFPRSVLQTTDGGYFVAGVSASIDGDVTGNHGLGDYWIVKLNSSGALQWQKSLGGTNIDGETSSQQSTDGGYIIAGYSYSNDGDVSGHHGSSTACDYWIVKLSPNVSINELNVNNDLLNIFPTPANNYITIELKEYKNLGISIYNLYGQEVMKLDVIKQKTIVEISKLNSGVYFAKLKLPNNSFSEKKFLVIK